MGRGNDMRGWGRGLGHRLVLGCLLVLAVLAAHLALMASTLHAEMVVRPHGVPAPAMVLGVDMADGHGAEEHPTPRAPRPILEDCSPGEALLPALLLLTLLVALGAFGVGLQPGGDRGAWPRGVRFSLPPPLAPTRRRALMQVFRN